jgi:hypothetical protein
MCEMFQMSCGLIFLGEVRVRAATAEVLEAAGRHLRVRVRALGDTGWMTRHFGQALLDPEGTLAWLEGRL